jgi:aminoglycoside phosphotransferase (APT) family kinase protein
LKPGQWHRPINSAGTGATAVHEAILGALARALGSSQGHDWQWSIERQRLAGRSNIYVVRGLTPVSGQIHYVVKQPHTQWSQDDVGSPLTAHDEFVALERLDAHFTKMDVPFRVPSPVVFLPEIDGFAMEYVTGPTIKDLLSYRSVLRPSPLLDGLTAAGTFLRHLHALEVLPTVVVDLKGEAEKVLAVEEEKLNPLRLSLPDRVRRTMVEFPALNVTSQQVWLHGDFGPSNILLAEDRSTVGLDPALHAVGPPEDDLVRFVALVSGVIRLAPEIVAPPVARIRRELEDRLLRTYYAAPTWPPLFELRFLHQLSRRWCRLRELTEQHERRALVGAKFRVIGQQMRLLMEDSERRLTHTLRG